MLQQPYADEDSNSCLIVIAELKNDVNLHHEFAMRIWFIAPSYIYHDMINIGGMNLSREVRQ